MGKNLPKLEELTAQMFPRFSSGEEFLKFSEEMRQQFMGLPVKYRDEVVGRVVEVTDDGKAIIQLKKKIDGIQ